jgi:two-component system, NarL family, nitrate/nitrite response regulator NarL
MAEFAQNAIQILLMDDHALFREGVARLLGAEFDFKVAASCGSIEEGLDVLKRKLIDIVLLDFYLGERSGKEFLRLSREQGFAGKVLLVTVGVNQSEVAELVRAGVSGIFLKRDSPSLLAQVIRRVVGGGVWFEQEQLQNVVSTDTSDTRESKKNILTERERQVLSYVMEGLTNRKIGEQIGMSTGSVKSTMHQLFSKTGVHTRSQLVRFVLEDSGTSTYYALLLRNDG